MQKNEKILQVSAHEQLMMEYYRNFCSGSIRFDYVLRKDGVDFRFKDDPEFDGLLFYLTPLQVSVFSWIKELRKVIRDGGYRVVHLHLGWANLYGLVCCIGLNVRVISHNHSFYQAPNAFKRIMRMPMKWLIHNLSWGRLGCSINSIDQMFYKGAWVLKNAINYAKFQFNTKARVRTRRQLGLTSNELTLCHVGNFSASKNHNFLIKTFAALKVVHRDAKLLCVGDDYGTLTGAQQLTDTLNISGDVLFLGARSDVADILSASDIFLFPSLYEGFGIALLEAQVSGLPCVYTNTMPKDAVLAQSCFSCGIETENISCWLEAISSCVELGLGITARMARSTAIDSSFDVSNVAHELEKYYLKALTP